ncbi:MAG: BREX-1 system adenine-specific DNA-methyltransferase PglX [Peptococcaceae bacterium]|jgi:type II restriction/modification system DNA methylase subunit YeeA|nr:BREX-1 system adenine-specific DNA-methyltransferase PglX [Peptococcaceae bacterium]
MNKSAIQKYAVWARNELIEQVKQRAYQYGISDKGYGDENANVVAGRVLSKEEKRQRREFIQKIKEQGYQQAVEEVAYTWFNRFIALRFMEVNDYLPTHVRVFSSANGEFKPEILKEALHIELEGLDKAKVSELLNASKTEELYRYLLLTQCNALHAALPEMFEKMGSYTEMLLPNNILKPDGVLGRLITDIPEEDWRDAVQIIGWMYQYYNTEPKQAVFDGLKKNIKITKEKIPAATQLFTPAWIVRYMVENSLGRLWLESHPNSTLKANWKYYVDEAEQTPEVAEQLRVLREQSPVKSPEDIKLIDPCMGSGHILFYAFDVLMQIYESEGYNARESAKLILEKNLYGLEIDRRACQLAYFALMMKARQYNRRIFTENVRPQVYHPAGWSDGEEYGSLIKVDEIPPKPEPPQGQLTMFDDYERDLRVWNFRRLLAQKYDVVVTNPPYMGNKGHNEKLSEYLQKNYTDYKSDTFSAFIIRCGEMAKPSGFVGMFSPYVWMFIQSYEKLRNNLYNTKNITTLIQFEYSAFEEATVPVCSFVYRNKKTCEKGVYFRLVDYRGGMEVQRQKYLEALENPDCGFFYTASTENFKKIPGSPVAYWVSDKMLRAFEVGKRIGDIGIPRQGSTLGDNATFIRFWFEVVENRNKWFKCMKGGEYRRWYGNLLYLVDWENNGARVKATGRATIRSENMLFKEGVTWTNITSGLQSFRIMEKDFFFESTGTVCFVNSELLKYLLGFLNTPITEFVAKLLNPTLHLQSGDVANIPLIVSDKAKKSVDEIVTANISLSRSDWDSFETSWDFKRHPLINGERTVANAYSKWKEEANNRFNALKANEEELNRIFIDIYGLQDELTPEVEDKDVTVHRIYDNKEDIPESMAGSKYALTRQDVIKSFISYAVGCMFGRYSLDVEGLAYAGGEWDEGKYKTFIPDKDNVLPICDDEYFGDDIVGRFVEFVKVVYGAETLEENLKFIADALGGRGTPREVIRSYFLNDFYKDHCKTYKKRPIYWLFDSGKKNGFKALIYLHRYTRDLLAKLRTDYVHEQQERYRTQLSHINAALNAAKGAERARLLKQQNKLTEQLKEVAVFEEKVHHLADQKIEIDLDDGVKKNYAIFADVLAKI